MELAAVMLLIAILTVGTAVSLRSQLSAVQLEFTVDRIEALDRLTRAEAVRQSARRLLRVDAQSGRVEQWRPGGTRPFRTVGVGSSIRISKLRTGSAGRSTNQSRIPYSPLGQSASYGLTLESVSGQQVRLFVCGLSGQIVRLDSDAEFESFWSATTARPDTR